MKKCIHPTEVSETALLRAARQAVASALTGEFPLDPLVEPELSRAISCIGSVVKRHGKLIEMGIAGALAMTDRFIVLTNENIPLTKGAKQLLEAKNSNRSLAGIRLAADSEADGMVNVDLVVVDPEAGWAGAYEIKRGNGTTEAGKRRPLIQKLTAVRLVLASYARQLGQWPIETVTSAVIDYYGSSGFDPNYTLVRDQLDDHFGVPIVETVDAVTAAARQALDAELPALLDPVFETMTRPAIETIRLAGPGTSTVGAFGTAGADVALAGMDAPVGPGSRRTRPIRH